MLPCVTFTAYFVYCLSPRVQRKPSGPRGFLYFFFFSLLHFHHPEQYSAHGRYSAHIYRINEGMANGWRTDCMRQWSRRMCQSALLVESNRNCLQHKENLVDYWRFSSMGDGLEYPLGKNRQKDPEIEC